MTETNLRRLLVVVAVVSPILILVFFGIGIKDLTSMLTTDGLFLRLTECIVSARYDMDAKNCSAKVNWAIRAAYIVPVCRLNLRDNHSVTEYYHFS